VNTRTTHLVRASTFASRPQLRDELRSEITLARESGVLVRSELYESFLQLYLFVGFPAALEAMRALEKLWPRSTEPIESEPGFDAAAYPEYRTRGKTLYARVYAGKADIVEREMLRLSPDLAAWAVTEGYGKTLSRPGLDIQARELCIVALLTQLGWDRQLFSHILGAINVGASYEDIQEAIVEGSHADELKAQRGLDLLQRAT
jgi:alkylhydroperoxidase/carboxymuconolactone decarboxylase family protein YurZ